MGRSRTRVYPEQHVRMNWPGGQFFAPESLIDGKGRRILWAWVTDPRTIATQQSTGSGVQSLPRVLNITKDGTLTITPAEELQALRRNHRKRENLRVPADSEPTLEGRERRPLELAMEIEPGRAREVGVAVRCSPDGKEETVRGIAPGRSSSSSTWRTRPRDDVVYTQGPLDTGGVRRKADYREPADHGRGPGLRSARRDAPPPRLPRQAHARGLRQRPAVRHPAGLPFAKDSRA